ncbi:transcriptional regulator [Rubricella aquisinus]|uniref:Transcriptional regulator n=1 Tax=Rubricella aquisinus TaxID=2028108 RepID=A0A840WYC5_9RHOB|nr:FMN-binding negative transcriptional regulator [Rubricella aquisinus]MBB5514675.1 transcriptional regulator [Rubricella aquisinus]
MHPNPIFRGVEAARSLEFVRARGFGAFLVNGERVPMVAHVPFTLSEDGSLVTAHLMRSNPIARAARDGCDAVLTVTGPDAYISPDWYGVDDQVPTWNYIAVHLEGRLQTGKPEEMRPVLDTLSADFEGRMAGKKPWTMDKMTPDVAERMMRMILPITMRVTDLRSTWKLGQNKPEAVRLAAADRVAEGTGSELDALAAWMRDPP